MRHGAAWSSLSASAGASALRASAYAVCPLGSRRFSSSPRSVSVRSSGGSELGFTPVAAVSSRSVRPGRAATVRSTASRLAPRGARGPSRRCARPDARGAAAHELEAGGRLARLAPHEAPLRPHAARVDGFPPRGRDRSEQRSHRGLELARGRLRDASRPVQALGVVGVRRRVILRLHHGLEPELPRLVGDLAGPLGIRVCRRRATLALRRRPAPRGATGPGEGALPPRARSPARQREGRLGAVDAQVAGRPEPHAEERDVDEREQHPELQDQPGVGGPVAAALGRDGGDGTGGGDAALAGVGSLRRRRRGRRRGLRLAALDVMCPRRAAARGLPIRSWRGPRRARRRPRDRSRGRARPGRGRRGGRRRRCRGGGCARYRSRGRGAASPAPRRPAPGVRDRAVDPVRPAPGPGQDSVLGPSQARKPIRQLHTTTVRLVPRS